MSRYPVPPVPDLARAEGGTVDEMVSWWKAYYDHKPVPWNYIRGIKIVRLAYAGYDNLPQLLAGCEYESNEQGRASNAEIVKLAAPLAFGRFTRVFDLPRRKFPFGRDIQAGYRIPFFFVEKGIVHLYHLQPRKSASVTYDQMCMVATIYKRFILDQEFYGQKAEVEIVDLAQDALTKKRKVRRYSLADLELWSERRLEDQLTLIAESLDRVWNSGQIKQRVRRSRRPDPDLPLFD